jgi:hypothetical protein
MPSIARTTDPDEPAYASPRIEDDHRPAAERLRVRNLLEVMDALPSTADIAFEPVRATVKVQAAALENCRWILLNHQRHFNRT